MLASLSEKQAELEQQRQDLEREKEHWEQALSKATQKQRELEKVCANYKGENCSKLYQSVKLGVC